MEQPGRVVFTDERRRDFSWTSGGMLGLQHESLIARGGYGEVHKVSHLPDKWWLTSKMRNSSTEVFNPR